MDPSVKSFHYISLQTEPQTSGSLLCYCPDQGEAAMSEQGATHTDQRGRTFMEAISEKYSPENFPYRRGPGMGVVVVPVVAPQGSPMRGRDQGLISF